jgi:hypothetical protein
MGKVDQQGEIGFPGPGAPGQGKGPEGVAVIAVPPGSDAPALDFPRIRLVLPGHLDGRFDRLRAPGQEVDLVDPLGENPGKGFGVFFHHPGRELRPVNEPGLRHLFHRCLGNLFLPVADVHHNGSAGTVDEALPVLVIKINAFAEGDARVAPRHFPVKNVSSRMTVFHGLSFLCLPKGIFTKPLF